MWQSSDGLTTMLPDGQGRRVLFPQDQPPNARHADWSPDGRRIVFTSDVNEAWGSFEVWTANADGSNATRLIDCLEPCIYLDSPAWSPDGRAIALNRRSETSDEIWSELLVVDADSGAVIAAVRAEGMGDDVMTPRWAPDSRRLVVGIESHLAPDGSLVGDPVGTVIGVVGLEANAPTFTALTDPGMFAVYPDWHPTDERILFLASGSLDRAFAREGSPGVLYIMAPDGSGLRPLTAYAAGDPWLANPAWTSNGDGILVTLIEGARRYGVGLVSLDGEILGELRGFSGAHARQAGST
jgi:Tol biopolymer transport system component